MIEARIDPLTGVEVVVVGGRQNRPNLPDGCPFCVGGLEAPEPYDVRWFVNRWPPLPDGRAEVLLFSPIHDQSLGALGAGGVRKVVDLWAERTAAHAARDDAAYVLLFENRGSVVGATIDHPHGQLFTFDHVPEAALREIDRDECVLCGVDRSGREVVTSAGWTAVVPYAPMWPYEVLVAPEAHLPDLPSTSPDDRDALSSVLADVLARLDQLFDAPMPYMLWVHQRPTDGREWPAAHLHLHIAPVYRRAESLRYVAAGELGSGVWFNPIIPEDAAETLRNLPGAGA
ncbi:MAG TPA: galactose-1-phosphate uridylyltransferase [Acidimicrobiales bacterium]|jgi:UDPglucose--hexose-1-phosphate uridylyltransferase|nr:galactose-1-phosphate uridylyltransferase [Acidimicrobiales bacterium]